MKLIDFDEQYSLYLNDWLEKNQHRFQNAEELEEQAPDIYLRFLNTPAAWLDGKTPGQAFDGESDGGKLVELLKRYIDEDVPVPDPLLDRIAQVGDENALLAAVTDKTASGQARMYCVELLRQLDSAAPMVDYIRWQVDRDEDSELLDNALESLRLMGEKVKRPAKLAFNVANEEGKEALLDVLCDYPGDPEVFAFALEQFQKTKDKRALYAGYLAKLDDDHALEALLDVAESRDVSYIDFIEIRSAIERLGSEAPIRDFSNDPTYRAVKRLQSK